MPSRADQADKKTMGDAEQAAEACAALDAQLAELKAKYEQFFLGVDRTPPTKLHEVLKRGVGQLKATFLRQTAMKFRVQALAARLVTYERLWDRTLKEIEAGTYRRDVFKARLHLQARLKKPPSDPARPANDDFHIDEDLDVSDLDAGGDEDLQAALDQALPNPVEPAVPKLLAMPAVPAVTPARPPSSSAPPRVPSLLSALPPLAPRPPPPSDVGPPVAPSAHESAHAGGSTGLSDQKIKSIFEAYVMAKKRCGEDTRSLTLDSVAASLKKQVPALMRQHNAKSVEFKVVIKDGKALLRALPKDA